MNEGVIKFEGPPPFILPEAKSAQAAVFEKSVVMTLYSQIEGQGPGLVSIGVQMPPDVALALATQLTHAGAGGRGARMTGPPPSPPHQPPRFLLNFVCGALQESSHLFNRQTAVNRGD